MCDIFAVHGNHAVFTDNIVGPVLCKHCALCKALSSGPEVARAVQMLEDSQSQRRVAERLAVCREVLWPGSGFDTR